MRVKIQAVLECSVDFEIEGDETDEDLAQKALDYIEEHYPDLRKTMYPNGSSIYVVDEKARTQKLIY